MIEIKDLHASVENIKILKGLNLNVNKGEVHAIMGPNGSGKSTLCHALMGNPVFNSTGSIYIDNEEITNLLEDERSKKGLFQSFQYPVGLPGVTLREFVYSINKEISEDDMNELAKEYGVEEFLSRDVNIDLSGGEKKRSELFQLATMKPKGILLDEIDSGLDIDAIKLVAAFISSLSNENNAIMLVTHYSRILKYLEISKVHIIVDGKIVMSGDSDLIEQIDSEGYSQFQES